VAEGFVYLIKSGTFYKIDAATNSRGESNKSGLRCQMHPTLVHAIKTDDPPGIEVYWHRRFAEKRANGEWFKLTNSDVAAFRNADFN